MRTRKERENNLELQPVDSAKLAEVSGGVGPVFDVSKVEGPKLPSWYLPLSPKLQMFLGIR